MRWKQISDLLAVAQRKEQSIWVDLNTRVSVLPLLAVGTLGFDLVCVSSGILQLQRIGIGSMA